MLKKVFSLVAIVALLISCNNTQNTQTAEDAQEQEVAAKNVLLTINDFDTKAVDYVGKEVQIAGLVNHTCKHGGKRMFLIDPETEVTVKIEASDQVSSFDAELEGSEVLVNGIINELIIDEAYLAQWEQEIKEELENPTENEDEHADGEEGEEEHHHASSGLAEKADQGEHIDPFKSINNYRKEIEESGKDHLAFYSIECISYEIIPPNSAE